MTGCHFLYLNSEKIRNYSVRTASKVIFAHTRNAYRASCVESSSDGCESPFYLDDFIFCLYTDASDFIGLQYTWYYTSYIYLWSIFWFTSELWYTRRRNFRTSLCSRLSIRPLVLVDKTVNYLTSLLFWLCFEVYWVDIYRQIDTPVE